MGWLQHALGQGSGGGVRLNLGGIPQGPITPSGRAPQPNKSLVERFNVNDTFDSLSNQGVGLFAAAGQLPARIYESPISLVDTAIQRTTGFSPVGAVKNTPIGGIGGAIGEGIMAAGNFVPSLINSHDMTVWKAVADLPDSTPITDSLVEERLGIGGLEGFVKDFNENKGGVPVLGAIFGLGTRPKTVGEFREELAKRGFFAAPDGQPIDPRQLAADLRSGKRNTIDFGMAAINDNALVDFAGRMALDLTNVLFLVPGGGIARAISLGGRIAGKMMPAVRLAEAGVIAGKAAPVAAKSAEAIAAGTRGQATLRGLGTFLRGYRTLAIGTAVGSFGIGRASEAINAVTDDSIPFFKEVEEFITAAENNQPMSGNAAFMLLSAATFPYNSTVIRPVRTAAGKLREITIGVDDMAPFSHAYGGREKLLTEIGGPDSLRDLHGFLLAQVARSRHVLTEAEQITFSSMPDLAMRRRFEQQTFERRGARMWENKEITADDLFAEYQRWGEEQAGVISRDQGGNLIDQGVRVPFDPSRAARTWRTFRNEVRPRYKELLDETGEILAGERDNVIFVEQIGLGRQAFRGAAYVDKAGEKRVPFNDVLDFLEDNPNLNSLDKYGFWAKIIANKSDPLLKDVENKLNGQRRGAVKTSEYFAEAKAWEDGAPRDPAVPDGPLRGETRAARIERLRAELNETVDETGTILPDRVKDAQRIQRELEAELAEAKGIRWATDKSVDPEMGRAIEESLGKVDESLAPAFIHPGLRSADAATIKRVVDLEMELVKAGLHTKYRVKVLGKDQNLATIPDSPIDIAIRQRTAVGEWLFEQSPFSTLAKFMHGLTRKVTRGELRRGEKQALMNAMVGQGFTPAQINKMLAAFEQAVMESQALKLGSMEARWVRDMGSLKPNQINMIARRVLVDEAPTPAARAAAAARLAKMEKDGGVYRLLARTGSRYYRSLQERSRKGDKGAKALETIYDYWNDAPVLSTLATGQRVLAKTYYPIFRFIIDPRWLAMNSIEGQVLAGAKDGYIRAYTDMSQASGAARRFQAGVDPSALGTFAPDVGATLVNHNLKLIAARSFDKRSAESVAKIIDELGEADPAIAALRRNMDLEADDLVRQADRMDDAAEAAKLRARANDLREAGTGSMAQHLNDTLYRFEQDGPEAATRGGFERMLDADEIVAMRPLIDRVVEINRQNWTDVQAMLHGNPSRSTLERVGNSYWLYWPLSYQIKATKWLADIMLNGSFGHNNGALLAGRYALWQEQHNERMLRSPEYAAMYAANPELWFVAQMLLPMGPEDIGVSLGRATRLVGERAQGFANSWFGTDIGLFTLSMENERAIPWLTEMGPIYTKELFQRLYSEAEDEGFFAPDIPPSAAP